jgi:hypothetical protein
MADVQQSAFSLTSATLMVGKAFTDDVFSLTPDEHSVGMAQEVVVTLDSSLNELLNGVAQASVDAKRTGVSSSITGNVFEMTARNFLIAQAQATDAAIQVKRGVLTADVAASAVSLSIDSDPIPGDADSAITALGDIPSGSTLLIQRADDETDYVFPTISSGAATGTGPYVVPIADPYAIPANMSFPAGSRVWVVTPIGVGDINADELFCVKITGVLTNFDRPMTYVAPKVRVSKGFQLSYSETQYTSMPWEFKPFLLSRTEAAGRLAEIGTKRTGRLYVGA